MRIDKEHFIILHLAYGLIELEKETIPGGDVSPLTAFDLPEDAHIPEEIFKRLIVSIIKLTLNFKQIKKVLSGSLYSLIVFNINTSVTLDVHFLKI